MGTYSTFDSRQAVFCIGAAQRGKHPWQRNWITPPWRVISDGVKVRSIGQMTYTPLKEVVECLLSLLPHNIKSWQARDGDEYHVMQLCAALVSGEP